MCRFSVFCFFVAEIWRACVSRYKRGWLANRPGTCSAEFGVCRVGFSWDVSLNRVSVGYFLEVEGVVGGWLVGNSCC